MQLITVIPMPYHLNRKWGMAWFNRKQRSSLLSCPHQAILGRLTRLLTTRLGINIALSEEEGLLFLLNQT